MALITNTEELKKYLPVNVTFDYGKIRPIIEDVQHDIFEPYCGYDLISKLDKDLAEKVMGEFSDEQKALLEHIRPALANISVARYIPIGEVQIDDRGITTFNQTDSRKGAEDKQIVRLRSSLLSSGMNSFERLLAFLEKNVQNYPDHEPIIASRPKSLLPNASAFSECYQIFDSHLTFRGLQPLIREIEEDQLAPLLGSHYATVLANVNLSEPLASLRRKAQRALAYLVVADAIALNMAVELSAEGLRLNYTGEFGNVKFYQPPSDRLRESILNAASKKAKGLIDQVSTAITVIEGTSETGYGLIDNSCSKIVMM